MATTSALRPVLPPSAIPAAFSTYAFIAVDPIAALATVARESAISALSNPLISPSSSINPAFLDNPIIDPKLSNSSTSVNEKIIEKRP